jgi:hypothetical protein
MDEITIKISEDDAIVLFEFFERFEEKEELYFVHPAEYLSLMKISAQIDKSTAAIFNENYGEILDKARGVVSEGFESDFPVIREENLVK